MTNSQTGLAPSLRGAFLISCHWQVALGYVCHRNALNIQMLFDKPIEDVWLNGYYISPKEEGPTHTFYRCGDVLVMERYGDFWLGSNCDLSAALNEDALSSIKLRKIKSVTNVVSP